MLAPGHEWWRLFSDSRRRFDNILFMTITKQRLFFVPAEWKAFGLHYSRQILVPGSCRNATLAYRTMKFLSLEEERWETFKFFIVCLNYITVAWQQRGKKQSGFTAVQDVCKLMWHIPVAEETLPVCQRYWISKTNTNKEFPSTRMATMSVFTCTTKLY